MWGWWSECCEVNRSAATHLRVGMAAIRHVPVHNRQCFMCRPVC